VDEKLRFAGAFAAMAADSLSTDGGGVGRAGTAAAKNRLMRRWFK
jgi:hypothetical protein